MPRARPGVPYYVPCIQVRQEIIMVLSTCRAILCVGCKYSMGLQGRVRRVREQKEAVLCVMIGPGWSREGIQMLGSKPSLKTSEESLS